VKPLDFLVVTGTRRATARSEVMCREICAQYGSPGTLLVVGGAPGIDTAMEDYWLARGFPVYRSPAPWRECEQAWGREASKIAGPMRNGAMAGAVAVLLERGKTGLGIALPDARSRGTHDCVARLKSVGLRVEVRKIEP
jgi:hypothetical protein